MEDLPNVVKIFDQPIHVDFNFNSRGILSKEMLYVDTMKDIICSHMMSSESTCNSGLLLWLSENCISVLIRKQGAHMEFVVLDSHARDPQGRVSSEGVFVLLFFYDVTSLINYLCNTYLSESDDCMIAYQIQFLNCICTMTSRKRLFDSISLLSHALIAKEKRRQRFLTEPNRASKCEKKKMYEQSQRKQKKELTDLPN